MSSTIGVENISHTNGTNAMTVSSGGDVTVVNKFTSTGIDDNATSTAITVDASQNVGIGTSSPTVKLDLVDDGVQLRLANSTTGTTTSDGTRIQLSGNDLLLINRESANMQFYTADTERMRITSGGNFLVNTTTTTINSSNFGTLIGGNGGDIGSIYTAKNVNGGDIVIQIYGNAGKAFIYGDGDMANDNGTFSSFSDQTLKENIVDAQSQWADIKALQIRNYNLISNPDLTQIGVIAQELEASGMSGLVAEKNYDGEGNVKKTVKLSVLHMKAVKALQEAMTRIEALETANTTLEARITALENG
jgi:hypothetical protein